MPRLTRRDFVNAGATTLAASGVIGSGALSAGEDGAADYPPAKTGMRGSHDGSYELFHEMSWRGDTRWPRPGRRTDDVYDLVVVGGGLSGLSAAYYYLQARPEARVLVLENHDDFGGHARRVEFDVGGRTVLTFGGSTSITFPDLFNERGLAMLADIGIDWRKFESAERYDESWYERHAIYREGLFFHKAAHGVDLLMDDPAGAAAAYLSADQLEALIDGMPLSDAGRARLFELIADEPEIFPGLGWDEKLRRLARMSYDSYLREALRMPEDVIAHLRDTVSILLAGVGWDGLPADVAASVSMPGLRALEVKQPVSAIPLSRTGQRFIYTYPDGNATLARALVRKLVPEVAPGVPQQDAAIVDARFRYDELDRPGRRARIRLNAAVTKVEHSADRGHVDVTYVVAGKPFRVEARHVVLANWHQTIPYICPELPESQRTALADQQKAPMVYLSVVLKDWSAVASAGFATIRCPDAFYDFVTIQSPVRVGGHAIAESTDEPLALDVLHFATVGEGGLSPKEQHRLARHAMLTTTADEFEARFVSQFQAMYGGYGFKPEHIAGVTINRWPHGYAATWNSLFDRGASVDDPDASHVVGRRRMGRISIANSDANGQPTVQSAVHAAQRAVGEQLAGGSKT